MRNYNKTNAECRVAPARRGCGRGRGRQAVIFVPSSLPLPLPTMVPNAMNAAIHLCQR